MFLAHAGGDPIHETKISDPSSYIQNWDACPKREQEGLIRHWRKEIRNFRSSINERIEELKKRGDYREDE